MRPAFDVVALAVRVVLEPDGGHEVTVCKGRVQRFDLVVEYHVMRPLPLLLGNM